MGDAMEIDEVVFHEPRQELGHELAEDVTVVGANVVEAVIGDCDAAAQQRWTAWSSTSRAISRPEPSGSGSGGGSG
ncbi:MAG TPA: hypothetical protein VGD37_25850, partial [Kofleriaceae bacterium]